jgi:hypothetical protein
MLAIQELRQHRNILAHDLAYKLNDLDIQQYTSLLEKVDKALFKLSNYRTYMEIGSDPEFHNQGINWDTVKGHEYLIFEEVLEKLRILKITSSKQL